MSKLRNPRKSEILGNPLPLSPPGAWKKQQKADEGPPPLAHAREGLKTFVAKSLRKLLGAQLLMRAAYRFYKILPPPPEQKHNSGFPSNQMQLQPKLLNAFQNNQRSGSPIGRKFGFS